MSTHHNHTVVEKLLTLVSVHVVSVFDACVNGAGLIGSDACGVSHGSESLLLALRAENALFIVFYHS